MKTMQLSDIKPGQSGVVCSVNNYGSIKRRFMDLGLIRGSKIGCILSSGKGIKAYSISGAAIAIRREDAKGVIVEVCDGEENSSYGKSECR